MKKEALISKIIVNCVDNNIPFPNWLQIKILKTIIEENYNFQLNTYNYGICYFILHQMDKIVIYYNHSPNKLVIYFPLLTFENAKQFGTKYPIDAPKDYWWYKNEEGNANRIKFINWMIQELEKE